MLAVFRVAHRDPPPGPALPGPGDLSADDMQEVRAMIADSPRSLATVRPGRAGLLAGDSPIRAAEDCAQVRETAKRSGDPDLVELVSDCP